MQEMQEWERNLIELQHLLAKVPPGVDLSRQFDGWEIYVHAEWGRENRTYRASGLEALIEVLRLAYREENWGG